MEYLTKKWTLISAIAALSMFMACTEDPTGQDTNEDPASRHTDAFVDVFVKHVKNKQGADKYGLVFYAGGQGLTAVKAKAPDNAEYDLAEFWKGPGNLRRHPANNELQNSMPQTGTYEFTLTFDNGDSFNLNDTLFTDAIDAVSGASVVHRPGTDTVKVSWNAVSGVNTYYVKLTDKHKNETKPIFVNKKVSKTSTYYEFTHQTTARPGWMQPTKPAAGDTCYVFIVGVKFEAGKSDAAADQNKQMNTAAGKMIIW